MLRYRSMLVLAFLLSLPAAGLAQTSATEAGYAYATVEEIPITLALASPLNFGTFSPWGQAGYVNVYAANEPAFAGANVTILSPGSPARFTVTGTPNAPFTVVLPATRTASVGISSGQIMVVDFFFTSYDNLGTAPVLSSSGMATFTLGAKLLVNPNQQPGNYTGSFPLTVAY